MCEIWRKNLAKPGRGLGLVLLFLSGLASLSAQETWTYQDIGSPGLSGTTNYNDATGVFTLQGAGAGLAGLSDTVRWKSVAVEGVYSFDNLESAQAYQSALSGRGANVQIQSFTIRNEALSSFSQVNVDALSDPEAFLSQYSRLYGGTPDHGLQYIQRGTNFGTEHFFDKSVIDQLNFH